MGVVNFTPDSFSDGGAFDDAAAAIAHGRRLVAEGAAIVDVGGESTRPGAEPVPVAQELDRVVPVIEGLAGTGAQLSIDTMKLAVAEAALDAGATYVNDVTAFRHDPELVRRLGELVAIGRPLVIGTSRKSFLGRITGRDVTERVHATVATSVMAFERGARVFRVHDVAATADALAVAAATLRAAWPATPTRTTTTRTT